MKVLKFGGTSVGSAQRIKNVASIICDQEQKIVVLSAMAGTTNSLVEISECFHKKDPGKANAILSALEQAYVNHIEELYQSDTYKERAMQYMLERSQHVWSFSNMPFSMFDEKEILAQGELISTFLMTCYLEEQGVKVVLLPALNFMRITMDNEPDMEYIAKHLNTLLEQNKEAEIYITQGFICRNAYGEIDNLKRGGSDYSAALVGAAIKAEEIQIWTDIDGFHNNDPRIVEGTKAIRHLSFDEAAELAYFGAKILHPSSVQPAKKENIPVRLKNTLCPDDEGTLITEDSPAKNVKAVAAKSGITAIKIKSGRMLLAYGFLRKVFEIFESYQTAIDMVTTSEVGVSVTIDNTKHLSEILDDLKKFGTVTVDENMVIVCVVGDLEWKNIGFESNAMQAMKDIPVRMVSYGGSNYNISFLIKAEDKKRALQALSHNLFE